jgi:hypothetical protein
MAHPSSFRARHLVFAASLTDTGMCAGMCTHDPGLMEASD